MKIKTAVFAFLISTLVAGLCYAADEAFMGTWKLNEAKSKIGAGMPKNDTVVYAQTANEVTITIDGTDAGKPVHHVWKGKFDGKDYPAVGSNMQTTRAYTKVDANTLTYKVKKDAKDVGTGKVVVSADGKSRTVTETNLGKDGKEATTTAVYDKK